MSALLDSALGASRLGQCLRNAASYAVRRQLCADDGHSWKWERDFEGDPGVIRGTRDCSRWLCRRCGEEGSSDPRDPRYADNDY